MLWSEAEAARRRHSLWDGQVPRLAGQGEKDHSAHPGLGEERSPGRHLLTLGLPLGSDFHWDRKRGAYICPNGKLLRTSGTVHDGRTLLYRASKRDCDVCPIRAKCCTTADARKIPRDLHEDARDVARRKMKTKAFARSRDERKRVEMRFAHLKTHHASSAC